MVDNNTNINGLNLDYNVNNDPQNQAYKFNRNLIRNYGCSGI